MNLFKFRHCIFDDGIINRWTINTKYYTADVAVWMAHLHDEFSVENVPAFQQMTALVMVFDMNDVSFLTFISLQFVLFLSVVDYLILNECFMFAVIVLIF